MTSQSPAIEINQLTKRYGEFVALDSLTLQVERGQILGFIGPNGAGKTTTIRILVGLLKATSGTATIAGADCLTETKKIKRLVGYMPDEFGKYDNMRVSEYLDFFGAAYGIARRSRVKRIDEVLDIAGATHMKDLFVDALSRGMQQRVALARTMMHDPEVLILDEPANGLDPQARIDMRTMLLRLSELGKTLIVTSHILPELARICDVVAMITRGKLRAAGTVDTIMRQIQQRRTFEVMLLEETALIPVAETLQAWLGEKEGELAPKGNEITQSETERIVRFTTALTDEQLSPLLGQLIAGGETILQFREVTTDLEDAFLHVAGESNQDTDADSEKSETVGEEAGE